MKNILKSLIVLLAGFEAQAAMIQSVSNIHEGRVVAAVEDDDSSHRMFMEVDARNGKKDNFGFPNDLVSEEIVAVLNLPEYLVVISKGSMGKPRVHEYTKSSRIWMAAGDLNCMQFDEIEIEKTELRVQCSDENKQNTLVGTVKMVLDFTAKGTLKTKLPIQDGQSGDTSFSLTGETGKWQSLQVSHGGKKKTFTAKDLTFSKEQKLKKIETKRPSP